MTRTFLSVVALSATLVSSAFSQHIAGYTSLGTFNLRGTYITNAANPVTNKIYVSDSTSSDIVSVISGTTHKVTTTITVGNGEGTPATLAVNSTTNTIYVLNTDQTVSVIDGAVDQVIATIPPVTTDNCVINIVVDESANKVVLIDECSSTAYVLDGSSYSLLATVNFILQYGTTAAVNPITHLLYITGDNDHAYAVVDLTAYTASKISTGDYPYGVAVDTTYNRIFIGDDVYEDVWEYNGATNTPIGSVSLGSYNAFGLAVNQNTHILAVGDEVAGVYFFRDLNLIADGQVNFSSNYAITSLSANSSNNLFYTGVSRINALAFIQGPMH